MLVFVACVIVLFVDVFILITFNHCVVTYDFHGIGMFEVVTYVDVLKYVRTASKQMQKS